MSEQPAVAVETRPEAVIVRVLTRNLDEDNMAAVRKGIADAASQAPPLPFIVCMDQVKFVPSLTLGVLVRLVSEFRSRRQRLILVGLQPTVRQVITITRLDRVMEIMDDESAALRSVGASA